MTAYTPSDDDVRAKAYELWCAGGMEHGRDIEDWIRAKEILSAAAMDAGAAPAPPSIVQTMVDGVLGAASLAMGAAAAAVGGMLGAASAEPKTAKPKPEGPAGGPKITDSALEGAERKLRVAADARIQAAKTDAAGSTASDNSKGMVNPDG